jgi:hypothetical protein
MHPEKEESPSHFPPLAPTGNAFGSRGEVWTAGSQRIAQPRYVGDHRLRGGHEPRLRNFETRLPSGRKDMLSILWLEEMWYLSVGRISNEVGKCPSPQLSDPARQRCWNAADWCASWVLPPPLGDHIDAQLLACHRYSRPRKAWPPHLVVVSWDAAVTPSIWQEDNTSVATSPCQSRHLVGAAPDHLEGGTQQQLVRGGEPKL